MGEESKKYKLMRLDNFEGMQLSGTTYNMVIGLVLLWGFAINALMAYSFTGYILRMHYAAVIIAYLVLGLGGTFVVFRSKNPGISFLGFTMLAVGMGLILTYFITAYDEHSIHLAFVLTAIVTLTVMAVSMIFPQFFLGIGKVLFISLLCALGVDLLAAFVFHANLSIMDYVVVVIFAGYIGFDWARAQAYPKVLDNAIDSAADIYVDIVNIFIRILAIVGKKD